MIGVRFRGGCKEYYFDPHGIAVEAGQFVIVETAQGTEYAQCLTGNHEVDDGAVVRPLRALVRIATENDRRTMEYNRQREKDAFGICQRKIAERGLDMKLVRVECSFDGSKIVFFFTSEGRVDFRELVRDLAGVFRARIELRQIGVRDEAKMLGGLGICGRPFCCAQFLDDFVPVSIKMAKTQNLSLNPTKISGACGRLMCCLKYEQAAYEDAVRRMPKNDSFVLTPDGPGNVSAVNLVRETVSVRLDDSSEGQKSYHGCEIRVLRNGKGSREGIEIPAERPARFVKQDAEASWMPFPRPCSARWSSPSPMFPLCRKRLPPRRAVRSVSAVAAGTRTPGRPRTRWRGPHRSKAGGRRGRRQGKASRRERGKARRQGRRAPQTDRAPGG
ncbi:MAG: stage 0 sporulation family protein [Oscillospiraceae bacterium]